MTKQEATVFLIQLYSDYAVLSNKYGYRVNECMAESVSMAVQALQEVEQCNSGELKEYWQWYE